MTRKGQLIFAVVVGMTLSPLAIPFARADEIRDSSAIVQGLVPITGDGEYVQRAIDLEIRFKVNSARLTSFASRQLDELGKALTSARLAEARFEINGHTDASGDEAYNMVLSEKRAQAVKQYLVAGFGIDPGRLDAVGRGETSLKNPFRPNGAENRRVEIVNLTPPKPRKKTPPATEPSNGEDKSDEGEGGYEVIN